MKKVFIGILTVVYMVVSSGIAMQIHYCMGKKAGVDFYGANNDKCGKCGMTENKTGCCHNENKFIKLDDSYKNVYNNISFSTNELAVVSVYTTYNWHLPSDVTVAQVNNHSPPENTGPSACIMNCVFRL
jgi:uncharacterized protein YxeA